MGKEKKIGMAALGVLTLVLAGVAGVKLVVGGGDAPDDGLLAAGEKLPGSLLPQGTGPAASARPTALSASPAPLSARTGATSPPSLAGTSPTASFGSGRTSTTDKPPSATISRSTASSPSPDSGSGSSLGFSSRSPTTGGLSAAPPPAAMPASASTPSASTVAPTVAATDDRYRTAAPPPAMVTDRYATTVPVPASPAPATSYGGPTPAAATGSDPFGRSTTGPSPSAAPAPLPMAAQDSTALSSAPPSAAPTAGYSTDRYATTVPGYAAPTSPPPAATLSSPGQAYAPVAAAPPPGSPTSPGYGAAAPYSGASGSTLTPAAPAASPYAAAPTTAPPGYSTGASLATGRLGTAGGGPAREQSYTAGPNETFWSIAERVYGDPAYFRALYEYNRDRYPQGNDLRPGDVVDLPPVATLAAKYPDLLPQAPGGTAVDPGRLPAAAPVAAAPRVPPGGRLYVVQQGDTLFDIARRELGRASRWAEIYELNREQLGANFDYLTAGMQIALPAATGSAGDPTAVRPGAAVPR